MKKIITIALMFISITGFSQITDTWDAVKVGSTDIGKIYVGSNLVWEKESCQYGDINNFDNLLQDLRITITYNNCNPVSIVDATSGRLALDRARDVGCDYVGGSFSSGYIRDQTDIVVGDYLLDYKVPVSCTLYNYSSHSWFVVRIDGGYPLNETPIIEVTDGIITYIEYY